MLKERKKFFKKSIALSVCFAFLTLFIPSAGQAATTPDSEIPVFSKTLYFWSVSMSNAAFINFFFDKPGKDEKNKKTKEKPYDKNGNRTSKKKGNGED